MGRRGTRVTDDARWTFNRLAAAYPKRPPYPQGLVDRLQTLAAGGQVVDVGAGTGHLCLPLAARGLRVTAVEPARRMLERLEADAARAGLDVRAVHAAAEATGLEGGAFTLALLADASHWVDPELAGVELARLLAPGGALALVEVTLGGGPFMDALVARMAQANPHRRRPPPIGGQLFAIATPGASVTVEGFDDVQPLDEDALAGAMRSVSTVGSALSEERFTELVAGAVALARQHGGAVWARRLELSWARRTR